MPDQTSLFGGGSKVVKPDTGFSGNTSLVESLQQDLPAYRGINPYSLTEMLIEDDDFYDKFTSDFIRATDTPEMQQVRAEDPETYEQMNANFRKNFRKDLLSTSYAGETEKDTLVSRTASFRKTHDSLPIDDYKTIVEKNRKNYEKYGLIQDGEFVYSDSRDDGLAFGQEVLKNPELHDQLVRDRYTEFQRTMSASHNNAGVLDTPDRRTQAWVVYDNFGSEGLTQYINTLQTDERSSDITTGYQKREQALEFFRGATVNNRTIADITNDYIVGSSVFDTKYNDLINQASEMGVAPALMAGMVRQESNFNPNAISPTGAVGLLQFQPAFARESGLNVPDELYDLDVARMNAKGEEKERIAQELARRTREISTIENDDRRDPEKTMRAGNRQFAKYLERFDYDPEKAVAAWNAGAGRVDRAVAKANESGRSWKEFVPQDETRPHIDRVMGYANEYGNPTHLVFQPVEARDDVAKNVPQDLNRYTAYSYELGSDEELHTKEELGVSKQWLQKFSPEDYQKFIDVGNLDRYGEFADEYSQYTWNIYEEAVRGGIFDLNDLMDTIAQYGEYTENNTYRINYAEAPQRVKDAVNALKYDDEGDYMLQFVDNDTYDFRPNRREDAHANLTMVKNMLFATKDEVYRDEQGELQLRQVPKKGGLAGTWNTFATISLGAADFLNRHFYEPLVRTIGHVSQNEDIRAHADSVRDWTGVNLSTGLTRETDGFVPNAIGEVAPFIQYMGAMMIGGSGIVRGGAKAFSALTNIKKGVDTGRYAYAMSGSGRVNAMAHKLNRAVKNKDPWATASASVRSPWVTGAGVFYTGGMAVEAFQPKSESFANVIPQLLGYEPTNDLRRLYQTTSGANRVAMDIGSSLIMDGMFDTLIAGTKFLSAKAGQRYLGRTKFKGLKYNPDKYGDTFGGYEVVDQPMFRHDIREFWSNLTSELDALPIGNVGESMARGVMKGQEFKTLHDFTKVFIDDSEHILKDVRRDIRDNITYLNKHLGDGNIRMDEASLNRMVDEQYTHFIQNISDQTYGLLRTSSDELPLRFAQTLDNQTPVIREHRPNGTDPITPAQLPDYVGLPNAPKLIVKDGKVYEVDPQLWTVDLADGIRKRGLRDTKEDVMRRKIDALGENPSDEAIERVTAEVDNHIGKLVDVDGQVGTVIDYDNAGYTIRTADGDITRSSVYSEISPEAYDNMVISATNNAMVRARIGMAGIEPPTIGEQRLLPPADLARRERRMLEEIDNIEGRINDLQRRHELLDTIVDDTSLRASQRREITNSIKQLEETKVQQQRELSTFLRDNPQIQDSRRLGYYNSFQTEINFDANRASQYANRLSQTARETDDFVNKQLTLPFC